MSYRALAVMEFALMVGALLVGLYFIVLAQRDAERSWVHSVPPAVVSEAAETGVPDVRPWYSVFARVLGAAFLFLLIFLAAMLWCFLGRVAYSDSDLIRLVDQAPPGDNGIPRPDQLPREGD